MAELGQVRKKGVMTKKTKIDNGNEILEFVKVVVVVV